MNTSNVVWGIVLMSAVTFITRCTPFYLIEKFKDHPVVHYMAKILPSGIMLILSVYSISGTKLTSYPYGMPEIISILVICGLHIYKRSLVISLTSGILFYTVLLQITS